METSRLTVISGSIPSISWPPSQEKKESEMLF